VTYCTFERAVKEERVLSGISQKELFLSLSVSFDGLGPIWAVFLTVLLKVTDLSLPSKTPPLTARRENVPLGQEVPETGRRGLGSRLFNTVNTLFDTVKSLRMWLKQAHIPHVNGRKSRKEQKDTGARIRQEVKSV